MDTVLKELKVWWESKSLGLRIKESGSGFQLRGSFDFFFF